MKHLENIYEITQRLCGMIEPQGETNIDEIRLRNLQDTIDLTEQLINDIIIVARHKDRCEFSMSEAGKEADKFINRLRDRLGRTKSLCGNCNTKVEPIPMGLLCPNCACEM